MVSVITKCYNIERDTITERGTPVSFLFPS